MFIVMLYDQLREVTGRKTPLLVYERTGDSPEQVVQTVLPGPPSMVKVYEVGKGLYIALHNNRGYVMLVNLDDVFYGIDKPAPLC